MGLNFAPASNRDATERVSRRQMIADGAYLSTVDIDTLDKACAQADSLAAIAVEISAEHGCAISSGMAYRLVARKYAEGHGRLSATAPWWDERCTAAYRLLWRAANGRAVERGA